MDKKFEDKLKERLQLEEYAYDNAAWEKYQEKYIDKKRGVIFSNLIRTLVLLGFFLILSLTVVWTVFDKDSSGSLSEDYKNTLRENVENNRIHDLKDKDDTLASTTMKSIDSGNLKNRVSLQTDVSNLDSARTTQDEIGLVKTKVDTYVENDKRNRKDVAKSKYSTRSEDLISGAGTVVKSSSESAHKVAIDKTDKVAEMGIDKTTTPSQLDSEGLLLNDKNIDADNADIAEELDSQNVADNNVVLSGVNQDINLSENKFEKKNRHSSLANLKPIDFKIETNDQPFQIDGDFITVFKERKLSFYLGAGYVTSAHKREGVVEIRPFEPSVLKLGINYKLNQKMSLCAELNMNYQQNLDLTKEINYFNQSATNFWFFESTIRHRAHTNFELPILFKYQIEKDKLSLYSGFSIARLLYRNVTQSRNTNLSEDQINDLGLVQDFNNYLNPINGSLIIGVEWPIFKWLSMNARVNKGIFNLKNQSFWDEGNGYNDFFTFSTHVNF